MKKKIPIFKIFTTLIIVILIIGMGFNLYRVISLKKEANSIKKQILSGDYSVLTHGGTSDVNLDDVPEEFRDDVADSLENENESDPQTDNKFWENILAHTEIEVKVPFFSNSVIFKIHSPNMESFFQELDLSDDVNNMDTLVSEYIIKSSEIIDREYKVAGNFNSGKWSIDKFQLQTIEFLNTLSGGFFDSYSKAYMEELQSMMEEETE